MTTYPLDHGLPNLDWQTPPVEISPAEARLLLAAATSRDFAVYGARTSTPAARTARSLRAKRCVRYIVGRQNGWESGMWAAYPICAGWNALWRHHQDRHIDGCGQPWLPSGDCSGCSARRRLDLHAWDRRLETLTGEQLRRETGRTLLWCAEHGYVRADDVTTAKVCLLAGSSLHDGGLARVW